VFWGDESVDKPDSVPTANGRWRSSICDHCCQWPGAIYPETRASSPQTPPQTRERVLLILLRVGFTEPPQSPEVLVVSYTTVSPLPPAGRDLHLVRAGAVCSLWHCPAGRPGWALPTTLLCGVRTFLDRLEVRPRSPDRLVPSSSVPRGLGVIRPDGRATRVRLRARIAAFRIKSAETGRGRARRPPGVSPAGRAAHVSNQNDRNEAFKRQNGCVSNQNDRNAMVIVTAFPGFRSASDGNSGGGCGGSPPHIVKAA
jgi:hypothetical protein